MILEVDLTRNIDIKNDGLTGFTGFTGFTVHVYCCVVYPSNFPSMGPFT